MTQTVVPRLEMYNDQQSRFSKAFCHGGTLCSTLCENCGRTYFVTSVGHGDYSEGELEELQELAAKHPNRYIEVPDFGSVDTVLMNGKSVVIGCECDPSAAWSKFIEEYSREITEYLKYLWGDKLKDGQSSVIEAEQALVTIKETKHWKPMTDAPRNTTWINVRTADGKTHRAHWASNTSGEEQPAFEGWFIAAEDGFRQIRPIAWRHEE